MQDERITQEIKHLESHIEWCRAHGYIETANEEAELLKQWKTFARKYARPMHGALQSKDKTIRK